MSGSALYSAKRAALRLKRSGTADMKPPPVDGEGLF